ncbi:hypothetical protein ACFLYD_00935, partial [Chloroflexota bacterium]
MIQQWEYCLVVCTPMSGLDEGGLRLAYQLVAPDEVRHLEVHSDDASPLAAIGRVLNELGREGWELLNFDMTTNRGV